MSRLIFYEKKKLLCRLLQILLDAITLSTLQTKTYTFTNNVDPDDGIAHYEASHQYPLSVITKTRLFQYTENFTSKN